MSSQTGIEQKPDGAVAKQPLIAQRNFAARNHWFACFSISDWVLTALVIAVTIILSMVALRLPKSSRDTAQSMFPAAQPRLERVHRAAPTCLSARQRFLTKCEPDRPTYSSKTAQEPNTNLKRPKLKMPAPLRNSDKHVLLENTYMVEFAPDASDTDCFQKVTKSLRASHKIESTRIKKRCQIRTSLINAVSFSVNGNHSIEAIEMIKDAIAIYPVYVIHAVQPVKESTASKSFDGINARDFRSYDLTGVNQVHQKFQNYGKGVRVAVIDSGIYYSHPALGGCFGKGCKVEFGYDLVGDAFNGSSESIMPDDYPSDDCGYPAHGTHVAGIIAANATGITEMGYIPNIPFVGVAPQVTLGAYRVFGCSGFTTSDVIAEAICLAERDGADIINLSLGSPESYSESLDSIAIQRVIERGVYVVAAVGNSGNGGIQTAGIPSTVSSAMAVASVDSMYFVTLYAIIAPDGSRIPYLAGFGFGGWKTNVSTTIIVHNVNTTTNDSCSGPSKPVSGAVVLFFFNDENKCHPTIQCDSAAAAGAIGCLFCNITTMIGSLFIPSGNIRPIDGLNIIAQVNANPTIKYTFTDIVEPIPMPTGGTISWFSSFGLSSDLFFKPQISGIGGEVYSTISPDAAEQQGLSQAYSQLSGTSMSSPFVVGVLALLLASIGNPSPKTVRGYSPNGVCRPKFSVATDILQSTAKTLNIPGVPFLETTARQGAGLVNAYNALTSTTVISPSQLSLNDTVRKARSYRITIYNIGDRVAFYNISHRGAMLVTGKAPNDDQLLAQPWLTPDYATVIIRPNSFKLNPGKSRQVTLQFQPPVNAFPELLPIFSGFIDVTNQKNGEVVHVSYAGVVGDYSKAQIIVRNSPSGIVSGVLNASYEFISDEYLSTVNGSVPIPIISVLAWPTRLFFVEVVSADNLTKYDFQERYIVSKYNHGLISVTTDNLIVYIPNAPKNTAVDVQSFDPFYDFPWYGFVCTGLSDGYCVHPEPIRLVPNKYRIRFSALKHFGNLMNPNDFEVYVTPAFNLVY